MFATHWNVPCCYRPMDITELLSIKDLTSVAIRFSLVDETNVKLNCTIIKFVAIPQLLS